MAIAATSATEVVQGSGGRHGIIRHAFNEITEFIFRDTADFYPSDGVLGSNPRPREFAVSAFLTRFQFLVLRLFFGCKCSLTGGW